jgi:lysophospholipase L1-like esterase
MKRWHLRLAVGLVPVAAVVAFAIPAHAAAVDYVALGDSYASGTGAPPYSNAQCTRSTRGYPQLWANTHEVSSFRFVACGGATTDDVLNSQLSSLDAGTDLVTLQIGGNDVNFANTILSCGPSTATATCVNAINSGLNLVRTTLPAKLDRTYAAVHAAAPNAQKRTALNNAADVLTGVLRDRVAAAGPAFTFVDATQQFLGHGACGPSAWLHTLSLTEGVQAAHPNVNGNQLGYLPILNAVTG